MLRKLDATLVSSGIELCFAEMKDPVKDKLKRFGLYLPLGEGAFFPTVEGAVKEYIATHANLREAGNRLPDPDSLGC